jgi:hypothetical protein
MNYGQATLPSSLKNYKIGIYNMKFKKLIYIFFVLVCFVDVNSIAGWMSIDLIPFSAFFVIIGKYIALFILFYLFKKCSLSTLIPNNISIIYNIHMYWIFFILCVGILKAENYWDYKLFFYDNFLFLIVPISIIIGARLNYLIQFINFIFLVLFPFGIILVPISLLSNQEIYSRVMVPVSFCILILPFLKNKFKFYIIIILLLCFFTAFTFRANIIKILFSFLILSLYYFRNFISKRFIRNLNYVILFVPILLLILGVTKQFNIFANNIDDDKYTLSTTNFENESLVADTRTFLYQEILSSLYLNNTLFFGEGATGKYKSNIFTGILNVHDKFRSGSEVGILNIFLWSGLVGVLLLFSVILIVTHYGINYSNSLFCKYSSLYLSCHWLLMFVEEFTIFDINNILFWIIIGICSSNKIRELSESDIVFIFKNIGNKRINLNLSFK